MKNRLVMMKIVRVIVFFICSVTIWDCKRKNPEPGVDIPGEWQFGEVGDRPGPGYSWRLTVDDQTDPDSYIDVAANRLFYLKPANHFTRDVTLTVTKWEESAVNPSFRIYGRFQQCLSMSAPAISSGNFTSSGVFERTGISGNALYSGTVWTPALDQSPVNSKATFKFRVSTDMKDSLCTEGFIQADMIFPALITSEGSYGDGDFLYFVKKSP